MVNNPNIILTFLTHKVFIRVIFLFLLDSLIASRQELSVLPLYQQPLQFCRLLAILVALQFGTLMVLFYELAFFSEYNLFLILESIVAAAGRDNPHL